MVAVSSVLIGRPRPRAHETMCGSWPALQCFFLGKKNLSYRAHARDRDGCAGIRRQRRFPLGAACALDGDAADGCVPPARDRDHSKRWPGRPGRPRACVKRSVKCL